MKQSGLLLLSVGLLASACGDDDPVFFVGDVVSDVSTDSVADTETDAAEDSASDVADVPEEDTETDATEDTGTEDTGTEDTSLDTPLDAEEDSRPDVSEDAPEVPFEDVPDIEEDAEPDASCPDDDGDGVCNDLDRCPDGDDTVDGDGDGVPDDCDNCPADDNPDQLDSDGSMTAAASEIDYNWRERPSFVQALEDDQVVLVPIGFDWDFFGTTVDRIAVSSNGFLSVDPEVDNGCCVGGVLGASGPLPGEAEAAPPGVIAGFWEDLNPLDGGQVYHGTSGPTGSREFVIAYEEIAHCCGDTPSVSFQIVLRESGGAEVQCRECVPHDRGLNIATQGVESLHGEVFAALPGRNSDEWTAIDDGAEFTWSGGPGDGVGDMCDPCPLDSPDDSDGDGICDSDE